MCSMYQESGGASDCGDVCWGFNIVCYIHSCIVICLNLEPILFVLYAASVVAVGLYIWNCHIHMQVNSSMYHLMTHSSNTANPCRV
jgi:hypothetical protein